MSLNFVDMRSIIPALLQPAVATLFAFAGIAIGIGIRRIALHRLSLLVAAAMGVLLAVKFLTYYRTPNSFSLGLASFWLAQVDICCCG